jgi:hypothetical protein
MAIIGIVAVARNNAIGKDGKLPWHYSADLKHFKETTTGQAVVMGMNTWRSIGKPLPNRLNIVLSRSAQIDKAENLIFLRSETEALDLAKFLKCDLFVIGGSKTYAEFANTISQLSKGLRWDAEHDLERVLGPIAATRLVGGARAAVSHATGAGRRLAENVAEFLLRVNAWRNWCRALLRSARG